MALLIESGGDALDLDVKEQKNGWMALHWAAVYGHIDITQLLLQAGADPTIPNFGGQTSCKSHLCIPLLEAALAEPQRSCLLFKARALLDAVHATTKARTGAGTKGHPAPLQQQEAVAAAPVYLRQRVAQAQELPLVTIQHDNEEEKLAACVKYALGLEGGGIVLAEGQEPTVGMLPEVLVELVELLVPKWDPARKGRALGEGYSRWKIRRTRTTIRTMTGSTRTM